MVRPFSMKGTIFVLWTSCNYVIQSTGVMLAGNGPLPTRIRRHTRSRPADKLKDNNLGAKVKDPTFKIYIPEFIEVRAGQWSTLVHGVYRRVVSETGDSLKPPVYASLSKPTLYISFMTDAEGPRWVIAERVAEPGMTEIPYAVLFSKSKVPVFTKGWHVIPQNPTGVPVQRGANDGPLREVERDSYNPPSSVLESEGISAPNLTPGLGTGNPIWIEDAHLRQNEEVQQTITMKVDNELMVDEAREGTYATSSDGEIGNGVGAESMAPDGWECAPRQTKQGKTPAVIDFEMTGADDLFEGTLWSWTGWFLRRPVFALRSPLKIYPQLGVSEVRGDIQYMWAKGFTTKDATPVWYITAEIGNKNPSQMFAKWDAQNAHDPAKVKTPADYPAQRNMELQSSWWERTTDLLLKTIHNNFGAKQSLKKKNQTQIKINGLMLLESSIEVQDGPDDIVGKYYIVAEYLGYPFYRQDRSEGKTGYVIYRGHVLAADKDTWVIGSRLGSKHCIRAWTEDRGARYPVEIKERWRYWDGDKWDEDNNIKIVMPNV